ncbi:MAG: hypothetical protein IPN90_13505 [Elusimicrobia bacterium]|nr:hypothetical protein [Elusimicrobiota bacterium]
MDKTTLPVDPVVVSVLKPDGDATGQKLTVVWEGNGNGGYARYETRAPTVDNTWKMHNLGVNTVTYERFAANALVDIDIRASLGLGSSYFPSVSTRVWTRAQWPGAPGVTVPLSNQKMGIGFPASDNPAPTEYAIRLTTAGTGTLPVAAEYANLVAGVPGQAVFSSVSPIWKTVSGWALNNSVLLSNLPLTGDYKIVFYARNQQETVCWCNKASANRA